MIRQVLTLVLVHIVFLNIYATQSSYLIKCVKVVVAQLLVDNSGLFQEVVVDVSSHWVSLEVKIDVHVLAKSGGVVISIRLGVSERLQDVVGHEENVLCSLYLRLSGHVGDSGNVSHDDLGRFCLARARLARDDDARVGRAPLHSLVSSLGDGKYMRRPLIHLSALVCVDVVGPVDLEVFVRVDRDAHLSDVGVVEVVGVPHLQVVEKRLHVKFGQEHKVSDSRLTPAKIHQMSHCRVKLQSPPLKCSSFVLDRRRRFQCPSGPEQTNRDTHKHCNCKSKNESHKVTKYEKVPHISQNKMEKYNKRHQTKLCVLLHSFVLSLLKSKQFRFRKSDETETQMRRVESRN